MSDDQKSDLSTRKFAIALVATVILLLPAIVGHVHGASWVPLTVVSFFTAAAAAVDEMPNDSWGGILLGVLVSWSLYCWAVMT
jgi:hypothetical protein